jgi:hypothetical protein
VIRLVAALGLAALVPAGCGGSRLHTAESVAACLAERGVETEPRGDRDGGTEVLAFEVPGSPPARGLLIIVKGVDEAETLEQDIRESARAAGSVAHTVRGRNVIAHFLTARAPTEREQRPIRDCLD